MPKKPAAHSETIPSDSDPINPNHNNVNTKTASRNPFMKLVTACVAAFAGNGKPSHQREAKHNVVMKIQPAPHVPLVLMGKPQLHVDSINWNWTNQRQKRKARRRLAHLGVKNAHAR